MTRYRIFLLAFSVLYLMGMASLSAAQQLPADAPLTLDTDIQQVTVFPDMARISRAGTVALKGKGTISLDLTNLSDRMYPESFQLSGRGTAKVRIIGTSLERVFSTQNVDQHVEQLDLQLHVLKQEDRALSDAIAASRSERKFVESLISTYAKAQSKDMAGKRLNIKDWTRAGAFIHERLIALATRVREKDEARNKLKKQIQVIQTELNQLRSKRGRWTTTVHVELESLKQGSFAVNVDYLIPGAHWGMVYDAHLDAEKNKVTVGCVATVSQQSGEDWTDVTLVLSTARPSIDGTIPELHPRIVDFLTPRRPYRSSNTGGLSFDKKSRKKSAPALQAMAEMDAAVADDEVFEGEILQASVDLVGMATFTAPRKSTIPSDNSIHRVFLLEKSWDAQTHYELVPELSPYAYTAIKTTNAFDFPMLAGRANLFLGKNYVGQANLGTTQPGEAFTLPFGVDERIRVERKPIKRKTSESGIINKTTGIDYHYVTRITNQFRKKTVTLHISERIPTSRQEKIEVQLTDKTTKGFKTKSNKPGIMTWVFTLKPKAKTEIHLAYKVEYPKGKSVTGLP